jgi:hypothetical protein
MRITGAHPNAGYELNMRFASAPSIVFALFATTTISAATTFSVPADQSQSASHEVAAAALYIVQAATTDAARQIVLSVGAQPEKSLDIIHAVSAYLLPEQVAKLSASNVRLFKDRPVTTRSVRTRK